MIEPNSHHEFPAFRQAALLLAMISFAGTTWAQDDGDLDARWGAGGFVRTPSLSGQSPADVACAIDGNCYVAFVSTGEDFAIARATASGTFSGSSTAAFNLGGTNRDWPFALAVGVDGKPVVAGFANDTTPESQMAVARFSAQLASGLDSGFSGDGKATQNFAGTASALAVAVGPAGETVVAGCYETGTLDGSDFAILRLLPNGNPDNGFDGNGVRTLNFDQNTAGPSDDCVQAVAIQPDGKIVVAGFARFGEDDYDFAVARLNLDGSLDATFSPGGGVGDGMHTVAFDLSTSDDDQASGISIDRFGRIVLSGYADVGPMLAPALARLTAGGILDTSFDSDGKFVHSTTQGNALGVVALGSPSNRILYATSFGELSALTEDGDIDSGFGLAGSILIDDPGGSATTPPTALTAIGGMPVVTGESVVGGDLHFFVARYWMSQIFGDDFESGNLNGWIGW